MRTFIIPLYIVLLLSTVAQAQKSVIPKTGELYRVDDEAVILMAARTLMTSDKNAALITIDADGTPRARTVLTQLGSSDATRSDKGFTVWIMTRRSTRKVEQIAKNPNVTLYYNDDSKNSYVTLMGIATFHTDPNDKEAKRFYDDEYSKFFWPDLKKDFMMISVKPSWMEVMIWPTVKNHSQNWRPQAVVFKY